MSMEETDDWHKGATWAYGSVTHVPMDTYFFKPRGKKPEKKIKAKLKASAWTLAFEIAPFLL